MTTPTVHRDTELTPFAATYREWLAARPVENNVLATIVTGQATGAAPPIPDARWLRVLRDTTLIGVAAQTPPRALLVPELSAEAVRALAHHLAADAGSPVPGVSGPDGTAREFARVWCAATGQRYHRASGSRLYRLDELVVPLGVPGGVRAVAESDLDLVARWAMGFAADTGTVAGDLAAQRDLMTRRLRGGVPHLLWTVADTPVAMAMATAPVSGVTRIQWVYTPPEHRRHGYASALVAELSRRMLSTPDVTDCTLYADADNPATNRIYRAIGYRHVTDLVEYGFAPA